MLCGCSPISRVGVRVRVRVRVRLYAPTRTHMRKIICVKFDLPGRNNESKNTGRINTA